MAGYKMVGDKHMKAKIEKFVNEYQALLKNSNNKKHPPAELKREQWAKKVKERFNIAAADVVEVLRKNRLLNLDDKKEDEAPAGPED